MSYVDLFSSCDLFYGLIGKGYKRLTIITSPSDATVVFTADNKVVRENSVWVPKGTNVTYAVSATGYVSETNTVVVNDNISVSVELELQIVTLTISPTPSNATVVLTATDYTQVGNSISVPYGTSVTYNVSATGYITREATTIVTETATMEIVLIQLVTLTISPTPNDASIILSDGTQTTSDGSITVTDGASVTYTVSAEGYVTETDTIVVTETQTITITLTPVE